MDPLSVLGAVAASSQLAQQGLDLINFVRRIKKHMKNDPEFQRQIQQVEHVSIIASRIACNHDLESDTKLSDLLGSCLRAAIDLEDYLRNIKIDTDGGKFKRLGKSMARAGAEGRIEALLLNLEREKSSLGLYIDQIDSSLLQTVGLDIKDIKSMLISMQSNSSATVTSESIQKSHFMVPNRRIQDFLGREDVLAAIDQGFSSGPGPRIVVLRGLGGQGKTQIALEYCHRARNNKVQAIFWIDATSASTVNKEFDAIANHIRGPHDAVEENGKIDFVLNTLAQWGEPWLMVFDNYDNPSSFHLPDFIPIGDHGQILVTSRHADTSELAHPDFDIELPGLPKDDAIDLLLRHSRLEIRDTALRDEGQAIVDRLGCHPLAVVQAGSYIHSQKIRLSQFLDMYKQQRDIILRQTPRMSQYRRKLENTQNETALNVFTTWELSFQQLESLDDENKFRAKILTLFAFFNCQKVSHHIFEMSLSEGLYSDTPKTTACLSLFQNRDGKWDLQEFIKIMNELAGLSLIQWSRDEDDTCHLSLHPLVQDWIRLRTAPDLCFDYVVLSAYILAAVLKQCDTAGPMVEFRLSLPLRQELFTHLSMCEENRSLMTSEVLYSYESIRLTYHWFAKFYYSCSFHDLAEETVKRLLKHLTKNESESTLYRDSLLLLSFILASQGKSDDAYDINQQVLDIDRARGVDESQNWRVLSSMAWITMQRGDLTRAEHMYDNLIEACKRDTEIGSRVILAINTELSIVLYQQGKYVAAEEKLRGVLEDAHSKCWPENDAWILTSMFWIGMATFQQGQYRKALGYFKTCYQEVLSTYGADHEMTVEAKRRWLEVLQKVEQLEEKERDHDKVLIEDNTSHSGAKQGIASLPENNVASRHPAMASQDVATSNTEGKSVLTPTPCNETQAEDSQRATANTIDEAGLELRNLSKNADDNEMPKSPCRENWPTHNSMGFLENH